MDGLLVALAYFLAFRLRFEDAVPARYDHLFEPPYCGSSPVTLVVLAAFGLYQRLWTFVGQRDYEAVVKGVVVATRDRRRARSRCCTRCRRNQRAVALERR